MHREPPNPPHESNEQVFNKTADALERLHHGEKACIVRFYNEAHKFTDILYPQETLEELGAAIEHAYGQIRIKEGGDVAVREARLDQLESIERELRKTIAQIKSARDNMREQLFGFPFTELVSQEDRAYKELFETSSRLNRGDVSKEQFEAVKRHWWRLNAVMNLVAVKRTTSSFSTELG